MARLSTRPSQAPSPLAASIKLAQAKAGLKNEELARRLGVGIRLLQLGVVVA